MNNFKSIGKGCMISPFARFYNPEVIEIGDNVRIDDFCIISGGSGIKIGSHIHIACYVSMFGGSKITLHDFSNVASGSILLSESDDFLGYSLIGPQIPKKYKPVYHKGPIVLYRQVILGVRTIVLPNVSIGAGVAVGAGSLVNRDLEAWQVYAGVPAKYIKNRKIDVLEQEYLFLKEWNEKNGK